MAAALIATLRAPIQLFIRVTEIEALALWVNPQPVGVGGDDDSDPDPDAEVPGLPEGDY